jgi:hypothetical protein
MTRALALPLLLLLAACSGFAPAQTRATAFQNAQTGQVVAACGPMQGFKGAIEEAQKGCSQSYQDAGWHQVSVAVGMTARSE